MPSETAVWYGESMERELCGWLIKGDPDRPCVYKLDHKDRSHRDATYLEGRRGCQREYSREYSREYHRERRAADPEFCEYRVEKLREWRALTVKGQTQRERANMTPEEQAVYLKEIEKAIGKDFFEVVLGEDTSA